MDFGSSYILKEEEEEQPSKPSQSSIKHEEIYYEDTSGYECEIMDFEEDEDDTQSQANKVNINTVKIGMNKLEEKSDVILEKSKLVTCQTVSCGAVYSHLAKIDHDKKVWTCNFCDNENEYHDELPDLSDKNDVIYVEKISNTPVLQPQDSKKHKIIFVIDTSSSMCQTKPMDLSRVSPTLRKIYDKDQESQMRQALLYIQSLTPLVQDPNVIEVSRLQAFKASVIEAVEGLSKSEQRDMQIGLVTFHEAVNVFGHGDKNITVEGGELADLARLETIGKEHAFLDTVNDSAQYLIHKIENLQEMGRTALGPALVIALRMASDTAGSKVILCTDGVANIGLGRMEETTDEEINNFYSNVIEESIKFGVSISIICVDTAGLNKKLGEVPTETGGILEKTEAADVGRVFSEVFKKATVALDADIKFLVHKDMYVVNTKEPDSKCSEYKKLIGNLQLDKQMSFDFAFRQNDSQKPSDASEPRATGNGETKSDDKVLPFQVQLKYTDYAGINAVRVWTAERKLTKSRAKAEDAMNVKTVVGSFIQLSSQEMLTHRDSRGNVIELAYKFFKLGNDYLQNEHCSDQDTKEDLQKFLLVMSTIIQNRQINDDQIARLNHFSEGKTVQVQC